MTDTPASGPGHAADTTAAAGHADPAPVLPAGHTRRGGTMYARTDWRSHEPNWPAAVAKAQADPRVQHVQAIDAERLHVWWHALPETYRRDLHTLVDPLVDPHENTPTPLAHTHEPPTTTYLRAAYAAHSTIHHDPATHHHLGGAARLDNTPRLDDTSREAARHAASLQATAADRLRPGLPAGTPADRPSRRFALTRNRNAGEGSSRPATTTAAAAAEGASGTGPASARTIDDGSSSRPVPGPNVLKGKRRAERSPASSTSQPRIEPKRSRTTAPQTATTTAGTAFTGPPTETAPHDDNHTSSPGGTDGAGVPVVDKWVEIALTALAQELKHEGVRSLRTATLGALGRYVLPAGTSVTDLRRAAATAREMDIRTGLTTERLALAHGLNILLDTHPTATWREHAPSYARFLAEHLLPADAEHLEALHRLTGLTLDHSRTDSDPTRRTTPATDVGAGVGAGVRGRVDTLLTALGIGGEHPGTAHRWGLITDTVTMHREGRAVTLETLVARNRELLPDPTEDHPMHGDGPADGDGPTAGGTTGVPRAAFPDDEARAHALTVAVQVLREQGRPLPDGVPPETDPTATGLAQRYLDTLTTIQALPARFRPTDIHTAARDAITTHTTTSPDRAGAADHAGRPAATIAPEPGAPEPTDTLAAGPVVPGPAGAGRVAGAQARAVTRFYRQIPDRPFTFRAAGATIVCHGLSIPIPLSERGRFGGQDLTGVLQYVDERWRVRFTSPLGGDPLDHYLPTATSGTCWPNAQTVLGLVMPAPARPRGAGTDFQWTVKLEGLRYQQVAVFSHPDHRSVRKPFDEPSWAHQARLYREKATEAGQAQTQYLLGIPRNHSFTVTADARTVTVDRKTFKLPNHRQADLAYQELTGEIVPGPKRTWKVKFTPKGEKPFLCALKDTTEIPIPKTAIPGTSFTAHGIQFDAPPAPAKAANPKTFTWNVDVEEPEGKPRIVVLTGPDGTHRTELPLDEPPWLADARAEDHARTTAPPNPHPDAPPLPDHEKTTHETRPEPNPAALDTGRPGSGERHSEPASTEPDQAEHHAPDSRTTTRTHTAAADEPTGVPMDLDDDSAGPPPASPTGAQHPTGPNPHTEAAAMDTAMSPDGEAETVKEPPPGGRTGEAFGAEEITRAADHARHLAHTPTRDPGSSPDTSTTATTDTSPRPEAILPGPSGTKPPAPTGVPEPAATIAPEPTAALAAGPVVPGPAGAGPVAGAQARAVTRFYRRVPDHPFTVRAGDTAIGCYGLAIPIPSSKRRRFGGQDLTGVLQHVDKRWWVRFTSPLGGDPLDYYLPAATSGTCKPGDTTVLGLIMRPPSEPESAGPNFKWTVKLEGLLYQKVAVFSHPDHRSVRKPYDEPSWAHQARLYREKATEAGQTQTEYRLRIPLNHSFTVTADATTVTVNRKTFNLPNDRLNDFAHQELTGKVVCTDDTLKVRFTREGKDPFERDLKDIKIPKTATPGKKLNVHRVQFNTPPVPAEAANPAAFIWNVDVEEPEGKPRVVVLTGPDGTHRTELPLDEPPWLADARAEDHARTTAPPNPHPDAPPLPDHEKTTHETRPEPNPAALDTGRPGSGERHSEPANTEPDQAEHHAPDSRTTTRTHTAAADEPTGVPMDLDDDSAGPPPASPTGAQHPTGPNPHTEAAAMDEEVMKGPSSGRGPEDGFESEEIARAADLLERTGWRPTPGAMLDRDPDVLAVAGAHRHALNTLLEAADAFPPGTDFPTVARAAAADHARTLAHTRRTGSGPDTTTTRDTASGPEILTEDPTGTVPPAHTGAPGPADTITPNPVVPGPWDAGLVGPAAGGEVGAVTRFHRRIPDHPFTVRAAGATISCHGLSIPIPLSERRRFRGQDLIGVLQYVDRKWRVRFTSPLGGDPLDHYLPDATSGTCKPGDTTVLGLHMRAPARPEGAGPNFKWTVKLKGPLYQKMAIFSHPEHRSVIKPYDEPSWAHQARLHRERATEAGQTQTEYRLRIPLNHSFTVTADARTVTVDRKTFKLPKSRPNDFAHQELTGKVIPCDDDTLKVRFTREGKGSIPPFERDLNDAIEIPKTATAGKPFTAHGIQFNAPPAPAEAANPKTFTWNVDVEEPEGKPRIVVLTGPDGAHRTEYPLDEPPWLADARAEDHARTTAPPNPYPDAPPLPDQEPEPAAPHPTAQGRMARRTLSGAIPTTDRPAHALQPAVTRNPQPQAEGEHPRRTGNTAGHDTSTADSAGTRAGVRVGVRLTTGDGWRALDALKQWNDSRASRGRTQTPIPRDPMDTIVEQLANRVLLSPERARKARMGSLTVPNRDLDRYQAAWTIPDHTGTTAWQHIQATVPGLPDLTTTTPAPRTTPAPTPPAPPEHGETPAPTTDPTPPTPTPSPMAPRRILRPRTVTDPSGQRVPAQPRADDKPPRRSVFTTTPTTPPTADTTPAPRSSGHHDNGTVDLTTADVPTSRDHDESESSDHDPATPTATRPMAVDTDGVVPSVEELIAAATRTTDSGNPAGPPPPTHTTDTDGTGAGTAATAEDTIDWDSWLHNDDHGRATTDTHTPGVEEPATTTPTHTDPMDTVEDVEGVATPTDATGDGDGDGTGESLLDEWTTWPFDLLDDDTEPTTPTGPTGPTTPTGPTPMELETEDHHRTTNTETDHTGGAVTFDFSGLTIDTPSHDPGSPSIWFTATDPLDTNTPPEPAAEPVTDTATTPEPTEPTGPTSAFTTGLTLDPHGHPVLTTTDPIGSPLYTPEPEMETDEHPPPTDTNTNTTGAVTFDFSNLTLDTPSDDPGSPSTWFTATDPLDTNTPPEPAAEPVTDTATTPEPTGPTGPTSAFTTGLTLDPHGHPVLTITDPISSPLYTPEPTHHHNGYLLPPTHLPHDHQDT
ncbi:hypothetical protein [Kitasatospora sp. NPDC093102]|uniref:hypothetical protein n=1 Tax=Kitasatospora sp. NPDC093102 TaxID=3155069 RepID=UPI00343A4772